MKKGVLYFAIGRKRYAKHHADAGVLWQPYAGAYTCGLADRAMQVAVFFLDSHECFSIFSAMKRKLLSAYFFIRLSKMEIGK